MECRRGLATRILSVRLSNAWIVTKRKKELCRFFTLYERSFSLVFWEEWMVRETPSTWNFESNWPRSSEIADFHSVFAGCASDVIPSKKIQLTSPLRAFQWAQDEHRTLSLSPQMGLKNAVSKVWKISCENSETDKRYESVTENH